jgi:uncharacterized protein YjbJ (UPF0337 family)
VTCGNVDGDPYPRTPGKGETVTDGESTFDKLKGKAKELGGKATGNDRLEAEGQTDQLKAKAEELGNKVKDKVEGIKDSLTGNKKDDDA